MSSNEMASDETGPEQPANGQKCGYVAIVGRPNVGKSTLLNKLLGQKISITSKKAQTTRHQILGVKTIDEVQYIYVDTPGIHKNERNSLNAVMNKAALSALNDADLIIVMIDRTRITEEDRMVLEAATASKRPVMLLINKIDELEDKTSLLPFIDELRKSFSFEGFVPISAMKGWQLDELEKEIAAYLPAGVHLFPDDQVTDRSIRFLCAEILREKIMRQLGDEVPYGVAVEIEQWGQEGKTLHIGMIVWVEREGQRKILIGSKGEKLKRIGTDARRDIEHLTGSTVMLKTWVKVKSGWSNSARALKTLGYDER
ncbi:GTPase Era [Allohahella sp. A8]|uniref:GTPase Era n=1 Tax=Allohahella sp. A8 TaxID=3141461 RepID=UPI003A802921|tara:strand:+ start:6215 stop:7156 length:942 start_codon:yes stop_codon:yes gene_type:complete